MTRLRTAAALVWLPAVVATATWFCWRAELPDRIATHWERSGPADGFSSSGGFFTVLLVVSVVAATVATIAVRLPGGDTGARFWLVGGGSVAGGAAGIWVATATATLASPADARLGLRFLWFVLGLTWGAVVRAVAGRPSPDHSAFTPGTDALGLAPTERAAYSTTLRAPWLTGTLLATAAVMGVLATTLEPGLWFGAAVPIAAAATFGRIRVTADRRGLRLVAGLLGVTIKHLPLSAIVAAQADDINPVEWGGWGYRVVPGRSALVLRRGPALVLRLNDGRRFAVTLDEPEVPASLLTALLARAGT